MKFRKTLPNKDRYIHTATPFFMNSNIIKLTGKTPFEKNRLGRWLTLYLLHVIKHLWRIFSGHKCQFQWEWSEERAKHFYSYRYFKVQSCRLYDNKYMIALTHITNIKNFTFIAVPVFKLLSRKVLFINRKDNRNC